MRLQSNPTWSAPLVVAWRRGIRCAAPQLLVILFISGPLLQGQRPLRDQDVIQHLGQTISWYRDVSAWAQSRADSGQAFADADGLRQNSTEAVRLSFEFARTQSAIPADSVLPDTARRRTLAQSAAAADQQAEQA